MPYREVSHDDMAAKGVDHPIAILPGSGVQRAAKATAGLGQRCQAVLQKNRGRYYVSQNVAASHGRARGVCVREEVRVVCVEAQGIEVGVTHLLSQCCHGCRVWERVSIENWSSSNTRTGVAVHFFNGLGLGGATEVAVRRKEGCFISLWRCVRSLSHPSGGWENM